MLPPGKRSLFTRWAGVVHRRSWLVLALSGLVLAASLLALSQGGQLVNSAPTDTESGRAFARLSEELPIAGAGFDVLFGHAALGHDASEFEGAVERALAPLRADPRVATVVTPYDEDNPFAPSMVSNDGRHAFARVTVRDEFKVALTYYGELAALVRSDTLDVIRTGDLAVNHDLETILERDVARAEIVSLPLTLLLLLLVFGAVVAALLPLGVGVLAVLGGLGSLFVLARFTDVSTYSINITTLIGLGVAIDYSLFMVNRFREELGRGLQPPEALERTMATTGRAVFFSGLTVAIGLGGLVFFQGTFLVSMGLAGTIVVAFAVLYALTFLSAILALLGPRINKGRLFAAKPDAGGRGAWHAIAMGVMRRPVLVLVVTLTLILAAGAPFLGIRLASGDVSALPEHAESRRGVELIRAEFPAQDQTRIAVVLDHEGSPLAPASLRAHYDLASAIAARPDVLRIEGIIDPEANLAKEEYVAMYSGDRASWPPQARDAVARTIGERVAVLYVLVAAEPQSDAAREVVTAIRALPFSDGEKLVTGQTAFDMDTISFILGKLPWALLFVMVVTYLLMLLLTGSVLLPIKAILMNLLSITASFGALVWIFQEGNLGDLLGFTAQGSIDPTLPVIMFCIVFGLSMDYEVMMLSRMQEEYELSRDNRKAVAEGLEKTGRLITGAAAIMIVVFGSFVLAEVVLIKAVGLGLALAVLIDATIVRALIVPATMRLMGDLNWWGPRFLRRFAAKE